ITVNAMWPNACPPGNPTIEVDSATTTIVFKVYFPLTFVACAQVLTPFQAQQTYTPSQGGVQRIMVLTNDGRLLGEGQMVTQGHEKAHSSVDLTGEWHATDSLGSGLFLSHSFKGSDALIGGGVFVRQDGEARVGRGE